MNDEDKENQDIIESIFYDDEYGYVSKLKTLKHAREINKNIVRFCENMQSKKKKIKKKVE